jgi:hypothetical protein
MMRFLAWALLLTACRGPAGPEFPELASTPPLPCSVLVTGGAFVVPPRAGTPPSRRPRTFATDGAEVFELEAVGDALGRARACVRVAVDRRAATARRTIAAADWLLPAQRTSLDDLLQEARTAGHDCLLVVERIDDGPVEAHGVNGQWPITLTTWLLVGLGALIPDHVYEPRVSLRAALRDVQDGQLLQELVIGPGSVDLSLLQRTGAWGWVQSIVVPPFWVGDDDARVVERVRDVAVHRLIVGVAQRLKSVDVADRLSRSSPAQVEVRRAGNDLTLALEAREAVSFVRLRLDEQACDGDAFAEFHRRLLGSRSGDGTRLLYRAPLPPLRAGTRLQVLVQTVTGRVGSTTLDLREVR